MNDEPRDVQPPKIFPRNLTAKAAHIVRGNPDATRPESGVDNCFPGIEFDQRNLDRAFFPGLSFGFQFDEGARVERLEKDGPVERAGLHQSDLEPPLYLWAMAGYTIALQKSGSPPTFYFRGCIGLDVWRRVHDLLPGPVAIMLGPAPGFSKDLQVTAANTSPPDLLQERFRSRQNTVARDAEGSLKYAILVGDRAAYLNEDGVIDPAQYGAGDLTRTLCSPWQYDFRECDCTFWAAGKPDLVTSADGTLPYLDFLRKDRGPTPQGDIAGYAERRTRQLDTPALIAGAWQQLPIVLNDRESAGFIPPITPRERRPLTQQELVDELRYLATVEHAVSVEYLYAHYSLRAPLSLPAMLARTIPDALPRSLFASDPPADPVEQTILAAANEIFLIAVDEMRHLRWVNEALAICGEPPSIGRAQTIGRQLNRPFALQPLTPEQLDWFIAVEAPSQLIDQGVDGMYVHLLESLERRPDRFPEPVRLATIIKLIIDEGNDHHRRLMSVQQQLVAIAPGDYLRPMNDSAPGSIEARLQDWSDQNYALLLGVLQVSFALGRRAGGVLLEESRRTMFNVHETNHFLAARGVRARFTLPNFLAAPADAVSLHARVEDLAAQQHRTLADVAAAGGPDARLLAARQAAVSTNLFDFMQRLIADSQGGRT